MEKKDKTQGMVFILPKSREFFGKIERGSSLPQLETVKRPEPLPQGVKEAEAKNENELIGELKENLKKLTELQARIKKMIQDLDELIAEAS